MLSRSMLTYALTYADTHARTHTHTQVLQDKLRYAIAHCKAIDTDFAARGAVADDEEAGEPITDHHHDTTFPYR